MKYTNILFVLFALALVSCGGGKKVQIDKNPYLEIFEPYWQEVFPGQQEAPNSLVLILPYAVELENYGVDSVYFQGYHDALTKSVLAEMTVYRVRIIKDENANKEAPPVELMENEALVSYMNKANEKHYFKVTDIKKEQPIYMP